MHQFPGNLHYMRVTAVGSQEKNLRRQRSSQIRGIPAARITNSRDSCFTPAAVVTLARLDICFKFPSASINPLNSVRIRQISDAERAELAHWDALDEICRR
jgi:hypothetical protein